GTGVALGRVAPLRIGQPDHASLQTPRPPQSGQTASVDRLGEPARTPGRLSHARTPVPAAAEPDDAAAALRRQRASLGCWGHASRGTPGIIVSNRISLVTGNVPVSTDAVA